MEFKRLAPIFTLSFILFTTAASVQPVAAQTPQPVTIVVRDLTYWNATYAGSVDDLHYDKWPFTLSETENFSVTTAATTDGLTPLILLLDTNGVELTRAAFSLTSSQPAGSYALLIQPQAGSGSYNLMIRKVDTVPSPTNTVPPPTATPQPPTATLQPATATSQPATDTAQPPTETTQSPTETPPSPTGTAQPPTQTAQVSVLTTANPSGMNVGDSTTVTAALANVPADGLAGVEFTCTYNATLVEAGNITDAGLFGSDSALALNGPQNGSFIAAIAGSDGKKAVTSGPALTFTLKGLQAGQTAVECKARISTGDQVLTEIPSTPGSLTVNNVVTTGTLTGQVLASKPVTISLYNADTSLAATVTANPDGTFSLTAPAGTYTAVASASGFLNAQASVTLTAGAISALPKISLPAGDIDGNHVIDQFDAMTIGMGYNTASPAAADLNNDGVINVLDLELLAANYRKSGALAWQ